jgi:hypothetical protein
MTHALPAPRATPATHTAHHRPITCGSSCFPKANAGCAIGRVRWVATCRAEAAVRHVSGAAGCGGNIRPGTPVEVPMRADPEARVTRALAPTATATSTRSREARVAAADPRGVRPGGSRVAAADRCPSGRRPGCGGRSEERSSRGLQHYGSPSERCPSGRPRAAGACSRGVRSREICAVTSTVMRVGVVAVRGAVEPADEGRRCRDGF